MLTIQNRLASQNASFRVQHELPQLLIDDSDPFLEKLCTLTAACPKSELVLSAIVQECSKLAGFGSVLSALTIYANLQEPA